MVALAALVPLMTAVGTGVSVAGTLQQGKAAQAAGNYEAAGQERQGKEDVAAAQRQMFDQQEKNDFQLSKIRSIAAASGAGGSETPGINDIYGDTAQYGDFLARSQLYGGQARQAGDIDAAGASRFKGNSAYTGSILEGIGTGLMGAAKISGQRNNNTNGYYYG